MSNKNIETHGAVHGSLDIKRCYLPGLFITSVCPECNIVVEKDCGDDYPFSYPNINETDKPETVNFYHYNEETEEEHEWKVPVIINITVKPLEVADCKECKDTKKLFVSDGEGGFIEFECPKCKDGSI